MVGWIVLGIVWLVGPLLLTTKYVGGRGRQLVVSAAVVTYTAVMWTLIAANDSSTAAVGYVTMAPLAYLAPVVGAVLTRWRRT